MACLGILATILGVRRDQGRTSPMRRSAGRVAHTRSTYTQPGSLMFSGVDVFLVYVPKSFFIPTGLLVLQEEHRLVFAGQGIIPGFSGFSDPAYRR